MKRSHWAVKRSTRADKGYTATQVQNMLDAPFYSRSAVKTRPPGEETRGAVSDSHLTLPTIYSVSIPAVA